MENLETQPQAAPGKWSLAMRDGLLLSLVTLACTTLGNLQSTAFLGILLWIAKLVGSLWLLTFFMKRYGASHPEEQRTLGYGVIVCFFSSVVCAVFTYVSYRFLFPELIEAFFAGIFEMLATTPNVNAEMTEAFYRLQDIFPQAACFTTLLWDMLLGLVFSAIISAATSRKDPFTAAGKSSPETDELA